MSTTGHITTAKRSDLSRINGNLTFVIPCAGMGQRMRGVGAKSLIELDNSETILHRQIRIIKDTYPGCQIVVVIGFQFQRFHKLNMRDVRFIFNPIYDNTNVGFSVGLGLQASITDNVMVVYGDLVFNKQSILIPSNDTGSLIFSANTMNNDDVGMIISGEEVNNMAFGLNPKWSQILYLTGNELALFRKSSYDEKHWKWLGYEIINDVIDKGGVFKYYSPESASVVEIDNVDDLKRIKIND